MVSIYYKGLFVEKRSHITLTLAPDPRFLIPGPRLLAPGPYHLNYDFKSYWGAQFLVRYCTVFCAYSERSVNGSRLEDINL